MRPTILSFRFYSVPYGIRLPLNRNLRSQYTLSMHCVYIYIYTDSPMRSSDEKGNYKQKLSLVLNSHRERERGVVGATLSRQNYVPRKLFGILNYVCHKTYFVRDYVLLNVLQILSSSAYFLPFINL